MTAASTAIAAPFAYVSNYISNNVSVIDGAKVGVPGATAVTNVTVDPSMPFSTPWGVAVNATNTRAYVTNYGDNTVSVIDTATNRVVAKVGVGYLPIGIAVNGAGTKAYTANSGEGTVSVIDTATLREEYRIPGVGEYLYGIAVNPAGTYVYVTDWAFSSRTGFVQVIDAGSNSRFKSVPVGSFPVGVGVSPSGGRVYVANNVSNTVSVIDTSTHTVPLGWTLSGYTAPLGIAVSPSGLLVYVVRLGGVSSIWTGTNTKYADVPIANSPFGTATDPAGARVFVGNQDGTVSLIDASTNQPAAPPITLGGNPLVLGAFVGGAPSASCTDQLAALQQQLDAANATNASLAAQNNTLQSQVNTLTTQNRALQSQVNTLTAQNSALQSQVNTLTAQNSALQSQVNTLTAQNSALQSQVNTLTTQNKALQDQVNTLTTQNKALRDQVNTLTPQVASLVNHLFGAKVDVYVAAAARDAAYLAVYPAVSQPATRVTSLRVREAQREYREGLNAFAAGRYGQAVVHFRQAYQMAEAQPRALGTSRPR